jgi:hypothetical protein
MIADASLLLRRIHNPLPNLKQFGTNVRTVFRSELRQYKVLERSLFTLDKTAPKPEQGCYGRPFTV